jgi:hypothetical protein
MSKFDKAALVLAIITFFGCAWISANIYENLPHVEDEFAYTWQANLIARGELLIPSPPCPNCFLVPFVVDHNELRFGKYPIGWPAVLGIFVKIGIRDWTNPFLAGFSIWLVYLLAKRLSDEITALLTAFLVAASPMFLMNAGSLLSHIWSFWLMLVFISTWLSSVKIRESSNTNYWLGLILSGFSLGLLTLTRPLTAIAIAFPFVCHGVYLLITGSKRQKLSAIFIASLACFLSLFLFVWQFAVTGNLFLNPYQLWWPYDKLGFGQGIGLQAGGFSWIYAKMNTKFSLRVGYSDLFGWFKHSWIFLPFGMVALGKDLRRWLIAAIFPAIVLAYTFYWIGSWLYGPRYYFEALFSLAFISALGIRVFVGKLSSPVTGFSRYITKVRFAIGTVLVVFLVSANIFLYSPIRLGGMKNLAGVSRSQLTPFSSSNQEKLQPALIIVHKISYWTEYATLLELSSPFLDSPLIFTFSRGPEVDNQLKQFFPQRSFWHYYPDEPYSLYSAERPVSTKTPNVPMP